MAYEYVNAKGAKYFLHSKEVELKTGYMSRVYYFAKTVNPDTAIDQVPADRVIKEAKSGLPVLAKAAA